MAVNLQPGAIGLIYSPGQTWDLDIYLLDAFDVPFAIGTRKVTAVIESNGVVLETMTTGSGLTIANNNIKLVKDVTALTVTGTTATYNPQFDNIAIGQFKVTLIWENAGKDQPLMIFLIDVNADVQEREAGMSSDALKIEAKVGATEVTYRLMELNDSIVAGSVTPDKTSFIEELQNEEILLAFYDLMKKLSVYISRDGSFYALKYAMKSIAGDALKDSTINREKFSTSLESSLASTFTSNADFSQVKNYIDNYLKQVFVDTYYPFEVKDQNEKAALFTDFDGTTFLKPKPNTISKASIQSESIDLSKLASEVLQYIFSNLAPETGYLFAAYDQNGKIGIGLKTDGTLEAKFKLKVTNSDLQDESVGTSKVSSKAITYPKIADLLNRDINTQKVINTVSQDDLLRSKITSILYSTEANGSLVKKIEIVKNAIITNNSGKNIHVRKSLDIAIIGKSYKGTFDPSAINESRFVSFLTGTTLPSTAGLLAGDYRMFTSNNYNGVVLTGGTDTYYPGDLLVYNGTTWVKKSCPSGSATEGDFWVVTTSGKFDNIDYVVGDIIYCVTTVSNSGNSNPFFLKLKKGQFAYMGEFNPSSFNPSSFIDGQIYSASQSGVYNSVNYATDDYCAKFGGIVSKISNNAFLSIANNSFIVLEKGFYEFRNADKSTSISQITCNIPMHQEKLTTQNDIVFISDSMSITVRGTGNTLTNELKAKYTDRNVTTEGNGGSTSQQILGLMKYRALTSDINKASLHIFLHGRNNITNHSMMQETTMKMIQTLGATFSKYLFMSVWPNRVATFNGTRIVINEHENIASDVQIFEKWLEDTLPNNVFNTRKQVLAICSTRTKRDLQFPGLTEAQVASTYNILPFSFHFDYSSVSWTPEQLNFIGYRNDAGLPTGGSNLDYYIRTGNGTVGQLIVNVNGNWTEYNHDVTHWTGEGTSVIATLLYNYLTTKQF